MAGENQDSTKNIDAAATNSKPPSSNATNGMTEESSSMMEDEKSNPPSKRPRPSGDQEPTDPKRQRLARRTGCSTLTTPSNLFVTLADAFGEQHASGKKDGMLSMLTPVL